MRSLFPLTVLLALCLLQTCITTTHAVTHSASNGMSEEYAYNLASTRDHESYVFNAQRRVINKLQATPQWFANVNARADSIVLPVNTILSHATPAVFDSFFLGKPTWFSTSMTEGFPMILQNEFDGNPGTRDITIHRLRTTRALTLFLMRPTEAESFTRLDTLHGVTHPDFKAKLATAHQNHWYGAPAGHVSTQAFITAFCRLPYYDGWRNPFDQDEIMLCPIPANYRTPANQPNVVATPSIHWNDLANKVAFIDGWFCPWAQLSAQVDSNCGASQPAKTFCIVKNQETAAVQQLTTNRMHYTLIRSNQAQNAINQAILALENINLFDSAKNLINDRAVCSFHRSTAVLKATGAQAAQVRAQAALLLAQQQAQQALALQQQQGNQQPVVPPILTQVHSVATSPRMIDLRNRVQQAATKRTAVVQESLQPVAESSSVN